MRIRGSGPIAPSGPTVVHGSGKVEKTEASTPVRPSDDTTTVMGIPEAELTPKVRQALAQLMAEVHSLRSELELVKKRATHLEQLADQDSLAPVLNRRAFVRELSRHTAFAERYGSAGSVAYFDVNDMKEINDRLGHAAGDVALKHVADILLRFSRASDVVGRLGGDEFGVILAQSDGEAALEKATNLANEIETQELDWKEQAFHVQVAYGIHTLNKGDKVDDALDAADRAMYEQKRASAARREAERDSAQPAVAGKRLG